MSDKPIIMSGESVRGILAGRKTQTRRVMNPQPKRLPNGTHWSWKGTAWGDADRCQISDLSPIDKAPYQRGDRLWVRETWAIGETMGARGVVVHLRYVVADGYEWTAPASQLPFAVRLAAAGTHSPIHMPKWAARIWLDVTRVRCERVQEISTDDCMTEGVVPCESHTGDFVDGQDAVEKYRAIWDSLHIKPKPKHRNPWGEREDCFVSYPWEAIQETRQHRGLPWYVCGNPWVFVYEFKRSDT